jgi:NADH-quinone oxidoreductase subunit J
MPSVLLAATNPLERADLLLLLFPLVLGAISIYLLVPRPEPYPTLWGAVAGGVALVLAAVLILRVGIPGIENLPIAIENLLFYLFAAGSVVSAVLLVTQHNPARAALSFTMVVLSSCGLFLLLAAPFLMAATIIIYAGAIVVTFLFVLMLASQAGRTDADARSREPAFAVITGLVLLAAIVYVLKLGINSQETHKGEEALAALAERVHSCRTKDSFPELKKEVEGTDKQMQDHILAQASKTLGEHHLDGYKHDVDKEYDTRLSGAFDEYRAHPSPEHLEQLKKVLADLESLLLAARMELPQRAGLLYLNSGAGADVDDRLESASVPPPVTSGLSGPSASVSPGQVRRDAQGRPRMPADNSAFLGKSLFTDYIVPVEIGGLLLLIAVVGAIAIAHRHQTPGRAS